MSGVADAETDRRDDAAPGGPTAYVDVIVVGAGLSGVGAACHLRRDCADKSIMVLESRSDLGGTWDLFTYPGIRSDSDMFTLGYDFRPWGSTKTIADGASIKDYIAATAAEHGIDRLIRYDHEVLGADWDSATARWTVRVRHHEVEQTLQCSFLFTCAGYYRYDRGFTPDLPGLEDFEGDLVHPQFWPAELDWTDRRVALIGSGATAVTLAPTLAAAAAKVTLVQRSPSYIAAVPSTDDTADTTLRRLPRRIAYGLVRWKHILTGIGIYQYSRRRPERMRARLRTAATSKLPAGFDFDTHLAPTYAPWDQRLCAAPSGDFFRAVRSGKVELATDRIARVLPDGVELAGGTKVAADIVITATGLNLQAVGGIELSVDGAPVALSQTVAYKGMMLSGVPNFALTVGYTNASWTLKADLVARYVTRLLNRMDRHGHTSVVPIRPPELRPAELRPLIDLLSGYVLRSVDLLPKQGPRTPWRLHQNYLADLVMMRFGSLTDEVRFSGGTTKEQR